MFIEDLQQFTIYNILKIYSTHSLLNKAKMNFLLSEAGKRKDKAEDESGVHPSVSFFNSFYEENDNSAWKKTRHTHPLDHDELTRLFFEFAADPPDELRRVSFTEYYETMCRLAHEVVNRCKLQNKKIVLYLGNPDPHGTSVWSALLVWPILRNVVYSVATEKHQNFPPPEVDADVVYIDDVAPPAPYFKELVVHNRTIVVLTFAAEKRIVNDGDARTEEDDSEDDERVIRLNNTQTLYVDFFGPTGEYKELYYFDHAIGDRLSSYIVDNDLLRDVIFNTENEHVLFPSMPRTIDYTIDGVKIDKSVDVDIEGDLFDNMPPPLRKITKPKPKPLQTDDDDD